MSPRVLRILFAAAALCLLTCLLISPFEASMLKGGLLPVPEGPAQSRFVFCAKPPWIFLRHPHLIWLNTRAGLLLRLVWGVCNLGCYPLGHLILTEKHLPSHNTTKKMKKPPIQNDIIKLKLCA